MTHDTHDQPEAPAVQAAAPRRPLPPTAAPAEVADPGRIRIGAGLGLPPRHAVGAG